LCGSSSRSNAIGSLLSRNAIIVATGTAGFSAGWACLHRFDPEPATGFFQRAMGIGPLNPAMAFMPRGLGNAHILARRDTEGLGYGAALRVAGLPQ
jgi:hypothetical protein